MTRASPRLAAWVALGAALVGCATAEWSYDRRGLTPARLDHDLTECRREALRPYIFAFLRSQRFDQEVLNRCMERKGYTPRPPAFDQARIIG